jgi:hypothetical protein
MKKIFLGINFKQILLLVAIIYATDTYAQEGKKNYVGVSYSFGSSTYNRNDLASGISGTEMTGSDNFESITIEYARETNPNVEFCTGLTVTSAYLATIYTSHPLVAGSSSRTSIYRDKVFIFSLPLHVKCHFLKYLFVEGGVDLNYYSGKKDYRYGAGLIAGIGVEYEFHSGITFSASPFGQWSLLMGNAEDSMTDSDYLSQWGIKWGIGYRF